MKHCTAFSHPNKSEPAPACQTELIYIRNGFWDDVDWSIYYCPSCDCVIAAWGGVHWWNHLLTNPRPETLATGRELASERAEMAQAGGAS